MPDPAPAAETTPTPEAAGEDFAAMLEASAVGEHSQLAGVGEKVSGVVVRIGEEHSFVDFGGRSEGTIPTVELKDDKGELAFSPGDPLEAYVVSDGEEIRLSRAIQGDDGEADVLYQAFKTGAPVEGKVTTTNKWGLGVDISGVRAFCPISQIDTKFVQEAEAYRGQTLTFRILRFRDRGRNIVLSRRAILEEERDKAATTVRERLVKGARLEGTVTRLESFGAFVDLGSGVEGLVHVSELRHERVEHPKEVVEIGARVEVVILGVKNLGNRRKERISLSIKALDRDPWDEVRAQFKPGTVCEGRVESLEDYGAFVELAPNVRGMVHISEMAERRIGHPREVMSVGDLVKVAVMEVDAKRKRLRLSMRRAEQVEDQANLREFQERQRKQRPEVPSGGAMQEALKRAQLIE
ncbi:MAG: S1 RNA-binding domain-containing protein [Gemmatimonadota bacterium]